MNLIILESLAIGVLITIVFLSCRYIFLEFSNPADAAQAVKTANGYQLDKKHVFDVNLFSDFDL